MGGDFFQSDSPSASTIDVWMIDLDKPWKLQAELDGFLSEEERGRANRFAFPHHSLRFRVCRAMLRLGLAWYLGKSPREIVLAEKSSGKPNLGDDAILRFNVTHSGGLGLIAFTMKGEVGIDIEWMQREIEALEIASSHFTPNELATITARETREEQSAQFFRLWTRKEAVLKAAGLGIGFGLDAVDVSQQPPSLVTLEDSARGEKSRWLVRDLEMPEGFAGAVAGGEEESVVRQWSIDCDDAIECFKKRFPGLIGGAQSAESRG